MNERADLVTCCACWPGAPGGPPKAEPGAAPGRGGAQRSRLVSGQSAADFADHADNLAHGFGAMLCRVRSAQSGAAVLEFIRHEVIALVLGDLIRQAADNPDQASTGTQGET